jgi:hypothetical protein
LFDHSAAGGGRANGDAGATRLVGRDPVDASAGEANPPSRSDDLASRLGNDLGEALTRLEQIRPGLATLFTVLAWMVSGPARPTRRAIGLLASGIGRERR